MLPRPFSESGRATGFIHQGNHSTQNYKEKENAHVPRVRHLLDHTVLEHGFQKMREITFTNEQAAHQYAQEQGRVDFLGN